MAPTHAPKRPRGWHPLASLRRRVRVWWQSRQPMSDTLELTQRNVYILPSKPGLMFLCTLVVLLLSSINYQLNLGYLLTFLLAGAGVVGMHLTHSTLRGLTLKLKSPAPVFAGEAAVLEVTAHDEDRRTRYGVGLRILEGQAGWAWIDVPALAQATAHVSFQPLARGWHRVPVLTAETRFPLGIFRVWTLWRPASQLLAYPQPESYPPPLPLAQALAGGPAVGRSREGGETEGVRPYRRGDALKLVVWKKAAKADELVSRDTASAAHQEMWLDYQSLAGLDTEQRLSRLTAWVLAADHAGLSYGLRLPGAEVAPGHGDAHRRHCLERLALWA